MSEGFELPPFNSLDADYDGHITRFEVGQAMVELVGQGIIAAARKVQYRGNRFLGKTGHRVDDSLNF